MSLTNVADRLTAEELAREPRMMHVVAWFDGYSQGAYRSRPMDHPRHGFTPCPGGHP